MPRAIGHSAHFQNPTIMPTGKFNVRNVASKLETDSPFDVRSFLWWKRNCFVEATRTLMADLLEVESKLWVRAYSGKSTTAEKTDTKSHYDNGVWGLWKP